MTLTIGILLFPNVQQLDLTAPYEVFASLPGTRVLLVWKDLGAVTASTGLTLLPSATFAGCPPLDVLCVPGGAGVNPLLEDAEVLAFVRAQAAQARFVTSVCTGALVLGAAGLLQGRRATTHWMALDLLAAFGAIPTCERVVRDGPLITAGGVTAGIDFGLSLIAELRGRTAAEAVQLALEYAPAPPFAAGALSGVPAEVVALVRERLSGARRAREEIIGRICG